jgi:hypothetical protein
MALAGENSENSDRIDSFSVNKILGAARRSFDNGMLTLYSKGEDDEDEREKCVSAEIVTRLCLLNAGDARG